ncbi:hypothetical protein [Streptomyces sp. NPDC088736]|uniref:hypothetical protein n=1 Tax=Streptomyces sp. NPDC088736 TaxID=3365881 RepID=UPI0038183CA4
MTDTRHTADTITDDDLDQLYSRAARAAAALSDMTRDRDRQKWYVAENERKTRIQRERARQAEATLARILAALPPYDRPTHGDRSEGVQMGWDLARQAALAAIGQPAPAATEATDPEATIARVQRLLDHGPVGTCCAHLIHAALNGEHAARANGKTPPPA